MTTRINNPYAAVSPRSLSPSLAAAEPAAAALMANSLGVSTHSLDAGGSFYGAHSAPQQQHCAVAGDHYTRQASFTTTCSSAAGCSCYQAGAAAAAVVGSPMSATSNFHPLYSRQLAPQFSPQQQQQPHFPAAAATTMMAVMPMAAGACDAAVYAGGCHAQCEQCSTAASTPRSANTPSSSSSSAVVMTPAAAAVEVHGDGATHNNTNDDDDGMFSHDAAAAQTTEYGYGYQHHPQQHYAAANDDAVADGDAVATAAAGYYDAYAASVLPEPQQHSEEATAVAVSTVPLLHAHVLSGVVPFVPYDRDARMMNMSTPPRCAVPREALCRLFIGQLPYTLSDSELAWCFFVLTNGQATIFYIERIVHWRNGRQPSGCVHAYCYPRDRDTILALNQRVLFDECGLWVASPQPPQSAVMSEERRALAEYCAFLSADKAHRAAQRPYQCMCVQLATSTYLPHLERQRRLHAARAAQASRPAVFSGAAAPAAMRLFGAAAPAAAVPYYAMGARGAAAPAPSAYAQLAPHAW